MRPSYWQAALSLGQDFFHSPSSEEFGPLLRSVPSPPLTELISPEDDPVDIPTSISPSDDVTTGAEFGFRPSSESIGSSAMVPRFEDPMTISVPHSGHVMASFEAIEVRSSSR